MAGITKVFNLNVDPAATKVEAQDLNIKYSTTSADATAKNAAHVTTVAGMTVLQNDAISVPAEVVVDGRTLSPGTYYFPADNAAANVNDLQALSTSSEAYEAYTRLTGGETLEVGKRYIINTGTVTAPTTTTDGDWFVIKNDSNLAPSPAGSLSRGVVNGNLELPDGRALTSFAIGPNLEFLVTYNAVKSRWIAATMTESLVVLTNVHTGMELRGGMAYDIDATVANMTFKLPLFPIGNIKLRLSSTSTFPITITDFDTSATPQQLRFENNTVNDNFEISVSDKNRQVLISGNHITNLWNVYRPWMLDGNVVYKINGDSPELNKINYYSAPTDTPGPAPTAASGAWYVVAIPNNTVAATSYKSNYYISRDNSGTFVWDQQEESGGISWSVVNAAGVDLATNKGNILTNAADATIQLPALASVGIGHIFGFMGGDSSAYTIEPQTGEQVNDIVDEKRLVERNQKLFYIKKSATSWQATIENVPVNNEAFAITQDSEELFFDGFKFLVRASQAEVEIGTITGTRTITQIHSRWEQTSEATAITASQVVTTSYARLGNDINFTVAGATQIVYFTYNAKVYEVYMSVGPSFNNNVIKVRIVGQDYVPAGTLIPEQKRELIFSGVNIASGASLSLTSLTWQNVVDNFDEIQVGIRFGATLYSNIFPTSLLTNNGAINNAFDSTTFWTINSMDFTDGQFGIGYSGGGTASDVQIYGIRKQYNAIRAEDIPASDQSASGYMDFGNMRMQWGRVASTAGGSAYETFNLPAPFADDNYSIVGSVTGFARSGARIVEFGPLTTTTFDANTRSGTGTSNVGFSWQAMGLKP